MAAPNALAVPEPKIFPPLELPVVAPDADVAPNAPPKPANPVPLPNNDVPAPVPAPEGVDAPNGAAGVEEVPNEKLEGALVELVPKAVNPDMIAERDGASGRACSNTRAASNSPLDQQNYPRSDHASSASVKLQLRLAQFQNLSGRRGRR